ncbi:MAG: PDZ domain-containing protein [Oscillospiraceae bacterium]|nr:PDZ domain-containing protein [Oscillospiraceae bacterium]
MHQDPSSYGTGRDPQRKGSLLIPIIMLLLSCVTIHALTLLYMGHREEPVRRGPEGFSLEELPTQEPPETERIRDDCGLGLELSDVSEIQQRYWSLPDGVFVEQIETQSAAYAAGLRSGDLLLEIENRKVSDPEDCLEILRDSLEEEAVELTYYREGKEYTVTVPLE